MEISKKKKKNNENRESLHLNYVFDFLLRESSEGLIIRHLGYCKYLQPLSMPV